MKTRFRGGLTGDLVLRGGRVLDPSQDIDAFADVAVADGKIKAIGSSLDVPPAAKVVDVAGSLVCPGLVDLHAHVFEWATNFGVPPDDAGVEVGVTTAVDMGSAGAWTFPGWRYHIAEPATTDLFAFINITLIGSMRSGRGGPNVFSGKYVDADAIAAMHAMHPHHIRGIKTYVESGGWSQGWTEPFVREALRAASLTGLPIYFHTGESLSVDEEHRPAPDEVMPTVLEAARPGDVLGHCYSCMPDGILGRRDKPSDTLRAVVDSGVLLDVGHGLNFSFDTARRMIDAGMLCDTISSDVHCTLRGVHDESGLTWSLVGTMSKLWSLGLPLDRVVRAATTAPAAVIGQADDLGTLRPGTRADITVLDVVDGDWTFVDCMGEKLSVGQRLVPSLVVRSGDLLRPNRRLLRDLLSPKERLEAPGTPSGGFGADQMYAAGLT